MVVESSDSQLGNWVPVLEYCPGQWIGLVDGQVWVGSGDKPTRRLDPRAPMFLLPALERDRAETEIDLVRRTAELGFQREMCHELLPVRSIMLFALACWNEWWANLALNWIREDEVDAEIDMELHAITRGGGIQDVRVRAGKLLRRVQDFRAMNDSPPTPWGAVVGEWLPTAYRNCDGVPREVVVQWEGHAYYFHCQFDDALGDYPDSYFLYRLGPKGRSRALKRSWVRLEEDGDLLGVVPVCAIEFDTSQTWRMRPWRISFAVFRRLTT